MTQYELQSHYGPEEIGLRQPGDAELKDVEDRIFYSDHTQDETLRNYFSRQIGSAAFLQSEKPAVKTDTPHEEYGFTD